MKAPRPRPSTLLVLLGLLGLTGAALPAGAQVLGPGRPLGLMSTEHFDFYYPESLLPEAGRLASRAEGIREGLLPLVGDPGEGRLSVLLTDEAAQTNGFYTSYPSRKIVLFLSPPEVKGDLGALDDPLIKIFTHELAHFLSLRPRGGLGRLLSVFGDGPAPASLLAPENLAEGLAVLAESQAGGGRLQDRVFTAGIDEDLREGRRPSFWETAGGRDSWPASSLWYGYGAGFSKWLYDRTGAGAVAAFWDELAKAKGLVGSGPLFSKAPFRRAFGQDLDLAWTAFLDDRTAALGLDGAAKAPSPDYGLSRRPSYIPALAYGPDGRVFWADASVGAILMQDADEKGKAPARLAAVDGGLSRLATSPDGHTLLVSGRAAAQGLFSAGSEDYLWEYDLAGLAWKAGPRRGFREGSYLPDGRVAAIAARGMETDLVVIGEEGVEVLMRGSPRLSLGSPSALGPWLYCLANQDGRRIAIRLPLTGPGGARSGAGPGLEYLALSASGPAGSEAALADLGTGNGRLALALAPPGSAFRLGILDPETGVLLIQDRPPAGGAFMASPGPGSSIAYLARLSEGEVVGLVEAGKGGFSPQAYSWLPFEPEPRAEDGAEAGGGLAARKAPPLPLLGATTRLPGLDLDNSSIGILATGQDLTQTLAWTAQAAWAWEAQAADLGLALSLALGKLELGLSAWDSFLAGKDSWHRHTGLGLELGAEMPLIPMRRAFTAGLQANLARDEALAPAAPYAWGRAGLESAGTISIGYSDLKSTFSPPFPARGWEAKAWASLESATAGPVAGLGLGLGFHLPALRLDASIDLEASLSDGLAYGPGGQWVERSASWTPSLLEDPAPTYREYEASGQAGRIYTMAELGSALLDLEVQAPILDLAWARRLVLRAGGRAAFLAPDMILSSAWARLEFDFAPILGSLLAADFRASLELARAFEESYGGGLSWSLKLAYEVAP